MCLHIWNTIGNTIQNKTMKKPNYEMPASQGNLFKGLLLALPVSVCLWILFFVLVL
jgi:hypothetical protein